MTTPTGATFMKCFLNIFYEICGYEVWLGICELVCKDTKGEVGKVAAL